MTIRQTLMRGDGRRTPVHKGRASTTITRLVRQALLALLATALVAACTGTSTPPGPDKTLGATSRGGYLFLRWDEGLAVMLWHDLAGSGTANSSGFASGQTYYERGSANADDGRSLAWEVLTMDGREGQVRIGGAAYDLAAGNVFLVTTQGGAVAVRQLRRDLSPVPAERNAVLAFAWGDPDLAAFMNETPPATPPASPTPTPVPAATPATTGTPRPLTSTPAPAAERILFAPGATQAEVEGDLPEGGRAIYVMGVSAGQFVEMNAAVGTTGQGLRFSIVGADGVVVKPMGEPHVRTVVPSTQDYTIELVSDVGAVHTTLSVLIPVRVRFAPGATTAEVAGSLAAGEVRHYALHALAGQRLIVAPHTTRGQVGMVISGADGQVLLSGRVGQPGGTFDGVLLTTQDYLISVRAEGTTGADYTLEFTIPAAGTQTPVTIVGSVLDVSLSARIITLAKPVEGFTSIVLTAGSRLLSAGGDEIALGDVRAGMRIEASGRAGDSGALIADQVIVVEG
jgi:hypothetical protein